MKSKLTLISIVVMLGLSACSLPRLVKVDPTATNSPIEATLPALPTTTSPAILPDTKLPQLPVELAGSLSVGSLLLDETFDQIGMWRTSSDPEYGAELVDGAYRLYLNTPNWMVWAESGKVSTADFIMDVDTSLVNGSAVNNQGLICRYVDDVNFYQLSVGNDGWAEILKVVQGVQTSLYGGFVDSDVDPAKNHLQGFCVGDQLKLYVNGNLAAEAQDSDLSFGDVGLHIGSYDDPQVTIDFDNLVVYEAIGAITSVFTPEPAIESGIFLNLDGEWNLNYSDDFDTPNKGHWLVFNEEAVVSEWRNGTFAFDFKQTMITATSPTSDLDLGDVVVQADIYRYGDLLDNDMGLVCRYQDTDNFYTMSFGNENYVTIYKKTAGNWSALYDASLEIDLTSGQFNVAISCIGTELSLYIDGQLMARVNDSDLTTGDVGVFSGTYDGVPVTVEFDNFQVFTPK